MAGTGFVKSLLVPHSITHQNGGGDEISVAGLSGTLADPQPVADHAIGGAKHTADTLANLNLKITDAVIASQQYVDDLVTSGYVTKEILLSTLSIIGVGTCAIRSAEGMYFVSNPVSGDNISIYDPISSVTRVYQFGVGGDVTVPIGVAVTDTMLNFANAIIADGVWTATISTALQSINSANGWVIIISPVADPAGITYAGTLWGTWVTQTDCKFVDFGGKLDYSNKVSTTLRTSQGAGCFGLLRKKTDMKAELHWLLDIDTWYRWDLDGQTWFAASGPYSIPDATSASGGGTKGKVSFDSDKGLTVSSGVAGANFGTGVGTVCQGNDVRLSDSRPPNGSASGDLSGSYPSPTVAKLQGYSVDTTPPVQGQVPIYNGYGTKYVFEYVPREIRSADLNLYLDPVAGNDANSGLVGFSKKTYNSLIADWQGVKVDAGRMLNVYLLNNISETAHNVWIVNPSSGGGVKFYGVADYTTIAGPYSSDQHAADYVGTTGLGATIDADIAYLIRIKDGARAGDIRVCTKNTAERFYPTQYFGGDPGVANYDIVTPLTTITASTTVTLFPYIKNNGAGAIYIYDIFYSGTKSRPSVVSISGITLIYRCVLSNSGGSNIGTGGFNINSLGILTGTLYFYGVGNSNIGITLSGLVTKGAVQVLGNCYFVMNAGRIVGLLTLTGAIDLASSQTSHFKATASYNPSQIDGGMLCSASSPITLSGISAANCPIISNSSGHGIELVSGNLRLLDYVSIANATQHGIYIHDKSFLYTQGSGINISNNGYSGIRADQSDVRINGALAGTGNGRKGIYAPFGSRVMVVAGAGEPTLTGTNGNMGIENETDPDTDTWASVYGGAAFVRGDYGSIIRSI